MPRLAVAREDQVDRIYRESHTLWGAGLGLEDYREMWNELTGTPWGSRHAGFRVWLGDDGRVLSSLKIYRPLLQLNGRARRATVIGAIFTPTTERRRGHAADMVRAAVSQAAGRRDPVVLLFSDIGTAFYKEIGFRELPAEEQSGMIPRALTVPDGWTLVPMDEQHRAAVRRAHDAWCAGRPLAILRDEGHWTFLRVRASSFFRRFEQVDLRQRWLVALDSGRFVGYLITVEGRGQWSVREVGAQGGEPRLMASVLSTGAARARKSGLRSFHGWLPPGVAARLEGWSIVARSRERALPMLLPLSDEADLSGLDTAEGAFLPYQDQF